MITRCQSLPEREIRLDDLIESHSAREGSDPLPIVKEYAKENARSIRSLYLALALRET